MPTSLENAITNRNEGYHSVLFENIDQIEIAEPQKTELATMQLHLENTYKSLLEDKTTLAQEISADNERVRNGQGDVDQDIILKHMNLLIRVDDYKNSICLYNAVEQRGMKIRASPLIKLYNAGYPVIECILFKLFEIARVLEIDQKRYTSLNKEAAKSLLTNKSLLSKYANELANNLEYCTWINPDSKESIHHFIFSVVEEVCKKEAESTNYFEQVIDIGYNHMYKIFTIEDFKSDFLRINQHLSSMIEKNQECTYIDSDLFNALDAHIIYSEERPSAFPDTRTKELNKIVAKRICASYSGIRSQAVVKKLNEFFQLCGEPQEQEQSSTVVFIYGSMQETLTMYELLYNEESYHRIMDQIMDRSSENASCAQIKAEPSWPIKKFYDEMCPFWNIHPLLRYLQNRGLYLAEYKETEHTEASVDLVPFNMKIGEHTPITLKDACKLCCRDRVMINTCMKKGNEHISYLIKEFFKPNVTVELIELSSDTYEEAHEDESETFSNLPKEKDFQDVYANMLDKAYYTDILTCFVSNFLILILLYSSIFTWAYTERTEQKLYVICLINFFIVTSVRVYFLYRKINLSSTEMLFRLYSGLFSISVVLYMYKLLQELNDPSICTLFVSLIHLLIGCATTTLLLSFSIFRLNRYAFGRIGQISTIFKNIAYLLAIGCTFVIPVSFLLFSDKTHSFSLVKNMNVFSCILLYAGISLERTKCIILVRAENTKQLIVSTSAIICVIFGLILTSSIDVLSGYNSTYL